MRSVLDILIFFILIITYWLNHGRRQYFKKRMGKNICYNLKIVAKNVTRMLSFDKKYTFIGDSSLIKNGAILYSIHFGVWELMPQILRNNLNRDVGVLVNRYTDNNHSLVGKLMDKFFYYWRSRRNIKVFYPDQIFQVIKFIKSGGIFAVLVDGNQLFNKYQKIEKLAQLCRVPLMPFAVYYENGTTVMKIGCNLETLIKQRPYDYWWFYKSRRTVFHL